MQPIRIEHAPGNEKLQALNVTAWPIWCKEVSVFPWHYDELAGVQRLQPLHSAW